jgi:hypothetical protein
MKITTMAVTNMDRPIFSSARNFTCNFSQGIDYICS